MSAVRFSCPGGEFRKLNEERRLSGDALFANPRNAALQVP